MNLTTGVDLVPIARIAQYLSDGGDPSAIWTKGEIDECAGDVARLAGRWAAKEAVLKALRTGLATVPPTDIVIRGAVDGAPDVSLSGAARRRADTLGLTTWAVSISHDAGLAVASAVAG